MGEADDGFDAPLDQLVERRSHNLKVAISILAGSNSLRFISFVCTYRVVSRSQTQIKTEYQELFANNVLL